MDKRVVITGMGVVSPIATGIKEFHNAIKENRSGIKFIEELKNYGFACQIGGIPDISGSIYNSIIEKYKLTDSSKMIIYAIIAALEAWESAGFNVPDYDSNFTDYQTGCVIGSGIGPADIFGEKIIPYTNQGNIKKLRSTIVEHSMLSGASANLTGILALGNHISMNSSACSTGTESIILGYERIKEGKALRMIVGGSEAYSPYGWSGFDSMRVLTRSFNENPQKGSRPLSNTASGFVPGAGAGILILEEYESAKKRSAKIYGEIIGSHINSGGQRNGGTMSAPNSEGVIKCITETIKSSKISSQKIDYISGHLSSTMADPLEIKNWSEALDRKNDNFPYVNSLKSMTGHCIGASGAIETIAGIIQMNNNFIHASLNSEDLHTDIVQYVSREKIPLQTIENINIDYFVKASFGFGDVNSCMILKK